MLLTPATMTFGNPFMIGDLIMQSRGFTLGHQPGVPYVLAEMSETDLAEHEHFLDNQKDYVAWSDVEYDPRYDEDYIDEFEDDNIIPLFGKRPRD